MTTIVRVGLRMSPEARSMRYWRSLALSTGWPEPQKPKADRRHRGLVGRTVIWPTGINWSFGHHSFPRSRAKPTPRSCSTWRSPSAWPTTRRTLLRAPSGSSRHAAGSAASPTRSRARSPPVTVRACGCSAIRARADRGRCSSAATPAQSNGNIPDDPPCSSCPTTPGSWSPSPSATCPAPGPNCPRQATQWSAKEVTSSCPSPPNPHRQPGYGYPVNRSVPSQRPSTAA